MAAQATQDPVGNERSAHRGRLRLSGEQVVRIGVLEQLEGFSHEELAFHLADSQPYRRCCRIGIGDRLRKASALQDDVRRLRPETWEAIHRVLVGRARAEGIERGNKVRIDATVTETDIHPPDDAAQLWDTVRVITRLLDQAAEAGFSLNSSRRTRRAKRRRMDVMNAKKAGARRRARRDLVRVTEGVLGFADTAVAALPLLDLIAGAFASKANLAAAKERGVEDVCFSKGRSLEITDMVESAWVYKRLRRFRAGVEGVISSLECASGSDRCTWRGLEGFEAYALASVVSCNLLIIARHMPE